MQVKAAIRNKIDAALATRHSSGANPMSVAHAIADRIVAGEKSYTLKEVADICCMHPTTAMRCLRGKPGFLQFSARGSVLITESLLKQFIAEAVARGLRN